MNDVIGVLILHGFAGSRQDIMPLHEYLDQRGYRVSSPVLSGHERARKDLAQSRYTDWIREATDAARDLKNRCDRLIVAGFSMGGLIAVHIRREEPVEKLVLINTPVYYWNIRRIAWNLAKDFKAYSKEYFMAGTDKPLPALLEFQKILGKTKPLFARVPCPVLIMQTLDDDTVQPKSADYIFSRIQSEKSLVKLERGGHYVLRTDVAPDVCLGIQTAIDK
ncbi:MAG: alpha/beta fold hydrolase [Gracilibacteraceae bacterium]|jgi:carboxylesterase|nr:alpha/beta fold hydrolase [Gracilibacteraceae bacterium]